MNTSFKLIEGIIIDNYDGVKSAFTVEKENINCVLSSEIREKCVLKIIDIIDDLFFFIEMPLSDDEEKEYNSNNSHMRVYYLKVTKEVARAIIKRYGEIILNDGIIRFGFGDKKTNDEVYFLHAQEVSIYSKNLTPYKKVLLDLSVTEEKEYVSLWDKVSENNPLDRFSVENEGETVYTVIENLLEVGLTEGEVIEE